MLKDMGSKWGVCYHLRALLMHDNMLFCAAGAQLPGLGAPAGLNPRPPYPLPPTLQDTDALADTLIQQLDAMPSNLLETIPEEPGSGSEGWDKDEEDGEVGNEWLGGSWRW